jgi:hypothetical protein
MTGTDFPAAQADMQVIWFAKTKCIIDDAKYTQTYIECTLEKNPTCGDHKPDMISRYGRIPYKDGLADHTV